MKIVALIAAGYFAAALLWLARTTLRSRRDRRRLQREISLYHAIHEANLYLIHAPLN